MSTTIVLTGAPQDRGALPITLAVDASKTGPKIDRNIFGQFAEHLGKGIYEGIWVGPDSPIPNTRGIRNDVVAALKALKVPNVRWPGGCFADEYHWRKGIGRERQRASLNPNWGGVIEPNTFGTHEFMDFIDQIGSRGLSVGQRRIGHAAGSGRVAGVPDHRAADDAGRRSALPTGIPRRTRSPYLGIGNESWDCGGNMTPEYYLSQLKIYSRFVRNFNPAQREGGDQMLEDRRRAGGGGPRWTEWTDDHHEGLAGRQWSWDMDGLSLHNYTVVQWPPKLRVGRVRRGRVRQILQTDARNGRPDHGALGDHGQVRSREEDRARRRRMGRLVCAAAGQQSGFLVQQNSLRDAILAALNLNIFARHADRVRMANIAQMINVLQAMILTDKEKMVLTPTYHVFRMYVPFQDATFVPVDVRRGHLYARRRHAAARRRHRREGRGRQAVAGGHQCRSEPARRHRGTRGRRQRQNRGRRDAHRAGRRQREHLRGAEDRDAQAGHGEGPGRPAERSRSNQDQ